VIDLFFTARVTHKKQTGNRGGQMAKGQVIQKSIGMYSEDWEEIEIIARLYHTSKAGVVRMFADFWRENHDLVDSHIQKRLKQPAETETVPS